MYKKILLICLAGLVVCITGQTAFAVHPTYEASMYEAAPPFTVAGAAPLVLLVMGRDHKNYYEAYNDAADLDGDDELDIGFNPDIDYYGYFDSNKCYEYDAVDERFEPSSITATAI